MVIKKIPINFHQLALTGIGNFLLTGKLIDWKWQQFLFRNVITNEN